MLELQPYIANPPVSPKAMHQQACSGDNVTIEAWRDIWISQIKKNKETYGSFAEHSIGQFFNDYECRPMIIVGSGPSLKLNAAKLKNKPQSMGILSCLHNFHYMIDNGINVDAFVTLDAGPITIEEVSEGGTKTPEEYWEATKGQKLFAFIGTHPDLLAKWQGEVYFYNAPVPDKLYQETINAIEPFNVNIESGGCVLGACMMIAKGFLGSQTIIFTGADFCFSNENKLSFHPWDSHYDDKLGNYIRVTDIFGNSVKTWPSYHNFKLWFDVVAMRVPGIYINASESGTLGATKEGNLFAIRQMTLDEVFDMYTIHRHKEKQAKNPSEFDQTVFI